MWGGRCGTCKLRFQFLALALRKWLAVMVVAAQGSSTSAADTGKGHASTRRSVAAHHPSITFQLCVRKRKSAQPQTPLGTDVAHLLFGERLLLSSCWVVWPKMIAAALAAHPRQGEAE